MSSKRISTNDVEKRNSKQKIAVGAPTLDEKDGAQQLLGLKHGESITMKESSFKSCRVISSEDSKPVLQEYNDKLSCRFCDKKFSNFQSLGGHQNAHKKERSMLKMIGPNNGYYPNSFDHGAYMMHPMAHIPNPNQGYSLTPQNFPMTSSWAEGVPTSQWRLNHGTVWQQQVHSLSKSALKSSSSSASGGAGVAGLQGNPNMSSTEDFPSTDLDLTLKL